MSRNEVILSISLYVGYALFTRLGVLQPCKMYGICVCFSLSYISADTFTLYAYSDTQRIVKLQRILTVKTVCLLGRYKIRNGTELR